MSTGAEIRPALDAALSAAPDAMIVARADGTIAYVNDEATRLLGYTADELVGCDLEQLVPDRQREIHRRHRAAYFERPRRRHADAGLTLCARHRDGHEIPVDVTLSPFSDGGSDYVVSALRVVDDRAELDRLRRWVRQQEALIAIGRAVLDDVPLSEVFDETAALVSQALESSIVMLLEKAGDGLEVLACVGVSDQEADAIRGKGGPLTTRTIESGEQLIVDAREIAGHRSAIVRGLDAKAAVLTPLQTEGGFRGVLIVGDEEPRAYTKQRLNFLAAMANLVATGVDVRRARAERDETLRLLQAVLDNSPAAIAIKDPGGRYRIANRRFREMFGHPDSADDLFPPERAAYQRAIDLEVMRSGRPAVVEDVMPQLGGDHTMLVQKFPLSTPSGAVTGVGLIATDITDRLQAELERDALEAQVEQLHRLESLGLLAAAVAHDFTNLLGVINNYARFALDELPEGSPAREDLEQVRAGVAQGRELTRQLLAFGRSDENPKGRVELDALARETVEMLRPSLGLDVRLDVEPGVPAIRADQTLIEQALTNLLINARDAMPDGGSVTVTVRAGSGGGGPEIVVADDGPGMDPDIVHSAFEPFVSSKPGRGSGLGLATVQRAMAKAGGTVELETREGEGATFTLRFPAPGDDDAESARGHGETVLVVHAARSVREMTARLLRDHGYRVLTARDAADALARAGDDEHLDVLVTDLSMPGMSGEALAAELRATHPGLAVLFTSPNGDEAAPGPVLRRPFAAAELLRAIDELDVY